MKKFVWLNTETGEFSNSWTQEEQDKYGWKEGDKKFSCWKLIEYKCLTDKDFKFTKHMKLR